MAIRFLLVTTLSQSLCSTSTHFSAGWMDRWAHIRMTTIDVPKGAPWGDLQSVYYFLNVVANISKSGNFMGMSRFMEGPEKSKDLAILDLLSAWTMIPGAERKLLPWDGESSLQQFSTGLYLIVLLYSQLSFSFLVPMTFSSFFTPLNINCALQRVTVCTKGPWPWAGVGKCFL